MTSTPDYLYVSSLTLPAGQVIGSPSGVVQYPISSLPTWLQTADNARAFVSQLRTQAQNESRYFTSQPASFGTTAQPLFTFVDGDADLPPGGGAGLLVVTGILTTRGSAAYSGLILVLGAGQYDRSGGGNGDGLGAAFVAHFGATGNFLAPVFNTSGGGNSSIKYDSSWAQRALASTGPRVVAIGEF